MSRNNIIAACSSLQEAQSVSAKLRGAGLSPFILEEKQAAWRVRGSVHVTVPLRQSVVATRVLKECFPHLVSIPEEAICPRCAAAQSSRKPVGFGFILRAYIFLKIRLLGFSFCPACHRAWK